MRVQNSHSHLTDVPRIKQKLRRLTTGPWPLGTPLLHSPKTVLAPISYAFRYLAPALHVPSTPLPNGSPIQKQPPALTNSTQPILPRPPARGKGHCPFLVVHVDDVLPFRRLDGVSAVAFASDRHFLPPSSAASFPPAFVFPFSLMSISLFFFRSFLLLF